MGVERLNGVKKRSGAVNQGATPSAAPRVGVWRIQTAPSDIGAHATLVDELKQRFSQRQRPQTYSDGRRRLVIMRVEAPPGAVL